MGLYNYLDRILDKVYDHNSNPLSKAYNASGYAIWEESEEPVEPEEPFVPYTFAVISDAHHQSNMASEKARLESMGRYLASNMPEMIIASGDLTNGTGYAAALSTFTNAGIDKSKLHWVWGNHENNNSSWTTIDQFYDEFDKVMGKDASKSYSFDLNGDRFIIMHFRTMSRNRSQFTSDDLLTLQAALSTAGDKRVFLIQHCPDMNRNGYSICGASGKLDSTHWGYNGEDISWTWPDGTSETLDVRDIFRGILDRYITSHTNRIIWIHGHSHKPVEHNGVNYDTTYFLGNGYTVHIPSLGRPYLLSGTEGATSNGEVTSFGEWALFHVEKDSVRIEYYRTDDTTLESAHHLSGYDIIIPYAGTGASEEQWDIRLVGSELYIDDAPSACVRMDGNELILEDES